MSCQCDRSQCDNLTAKRINVTNKYDRLYAHIINVNIKNQCDKNQ